MTWLKRDFLTGMVRLFHKLFDLDLFYSFLNDMGKKTTLSLIGTVKLLKLVQKNPLFIVDIIGGMAFTRLHTARVQTTSALCSPTLGTPRPFSRQSMLCIAKTAEEFRMVLQLYSHFEKCRNYWKDKRQSVLPKKL